MHTTQKWEEKSGPPEHPGISQPDRALSRVWKETSVFSREKRKNWQSRGPLRLVKRTPVVL